MKTNKLLEKLLNQYDDLADFKRKSKCSVSSETCRRAIYEDIAVSIGSYFRIIKALGFSPKEMTELLIARGYEDNHEILALIDSQDKHELDDRKRALIDLVDSLEKVSPHVWNLLAEAFQNIAFAARMPNLDDKIGQLRVKTNSPKKDQLDREEQRARRKEKNARMFNH